MSDSVALETIVPAELDEALGKLAAARGTNKSTLVRHALAEYVLSEEAFIAAVEEGRAEARAGKLIPHARVVEEMRKLLASKL